MVSIELQDLSMLMPIEFLSQESLRDILKILNKFVCFKRKQINQGRHFEIAVLLLRK